MSYDSYSRSTESEFPIKPVLWTVCGILIFGLMTFLGCNTIHRNDIQNIQVVQKIDGAVSINREGGYYFAFFPKKWTYPKACSYYFSNDPSQSSEHDAPTVRYTNTGTGDLNCQVLYRIDLADDATILQLHEIAQGDDRVIEQRVLSTLRTIAQSAASKLSSTDAIKKYDEFYMGIRNQFVGNEELKRQGIFVEDFVLAGEPGFDTKTKELFRAQQEADLLTATAAAEKIKLVSETERAKAQFEKEKVENEGRAAAIMAKEVKDAERLKKLAEIEAEKKVAVEKLEKEQILVKMSKELEVAEVNRNIEAKNLEIAKLRADQKIVDAKAKKESIALAGEITEAERVRLGIEKETKIGIAEAQAKTYAHWNPQVIQVSGGSGTVASTTGALDNFLNMNAAKNALEMVK